MHRGIGPAFQLSRKMAASGGEPQILVQYLVLRKDLSQPPFSWPAGAVVAQACHAATAALHLHRDHPHTAAYLRELERMRKVVLEAPDETTLKLLAETLQQKNIDHKLWMEQPENIPTCIALRPYPKEEFLMQKALSQETSSGMLKLKVNFLKSARLSITNKTEMTS
ncbi:hypothetical protein R6Z07F_003949 [Ovis aries]